MKYRKKLLVILIAVLGLVGSEVSLRYFFGFGDAVLVKEDPNFEYIALPNQERERFGNTISYNEFSMRSDSPKTNTIKILGLGDSVLNGGSLTDQEELATTLLSEKLTNSFEGAEVQVLNISCASWGPDNLYAYLEKFGDFDASLIFMVVSSHDAFDTMDFKLRVGKLKNYPDRQYTLAFTEALDRYILPRVKKTFLPEKAKADSVDSGFQKKFNPGFSKIFNYAKEQDLPLLIYLHPEVSEVEKGAYNNKGKLILEFAEKNNIALIKGLSGAKEEHYLDHIHLNKKGQAYLFRSLYPVLKTSSIFKNISQQEPQEFFMQVRDGNSSNNNL